MSTTRPLDLSGPLSGLGAGDGVHRSWLDRVGIGASVLCAIHCVAAPFLLLLLPTAGSIWSHPAVHWLLAALVVPLALWVLYKGYRKHGKKLTLYAASLGAVLIVAGLIAPMVTTQPMVQFSAPQMFEGWGTPPATTEACSDACCPSIVQSASTGSSTIMLPPGSVLTTLGSLLLILGHSSNLLACRCFHKHGSRGEDKACGCRA